MTTTRDHEWARLPAYSLVFLSFQVPSYLDHHTLFTVRNPFGGQPTTFSKDVFCNHNSLLDILLCLSVSMSSNGVYWCVFSSSGGLTSFMVWLIYLLHRSHLHATFSALVYAMYMATSFPYIHYLYLSHRMYSIKYTFGRSLLRAMSVPTRLWSSSTWAALSRAESFPAINITSPTQSHFANLTFSFSFWMSTPYISCTSGTD